MITIGRKTDRGLPRFDDTDLFVLSDAEDLLPALELGAKTADETASAWSVSAVSEGGFRISRFRPRVESSYARIERHVDEADPSNSWWLLLSKNNVRSYLGRYPSQAHPDAHARIFDPDRPARIHSWLLSEVVQPNGTRTVYEYQEEDNREVPDLASEVRRRANSQPQRYLKRIRFGHAPPGLTGPDWGFAIVLDYGDHDLADPQVEPDRPWTARKDPFSRYRSTFEVRTRRLCRRILVFNELIGARPVLTHSTDLSYDEAATGARLTEISHAGYETKADGGYTVLRTPPARLGYTEPHCDDSIRRVEPSEARNAPRGLGGAYSFTDLEGEGLAGLLCEQADGWFYKRNEGEGRFAALETVGGRPSWANLAAGAQIVDLEADGWPCVVTHAPPAGYAERDTERGWGPFRPFEHGVPLDWGASDLRRLDLVGDGLPDLALLDDEVLRWRRSEGKLGFGPERFIATGSDEDSGPGRLFQNDLQCIFTADMSGDGLADIVRIRNGEVSYWPNLGYGRFGERVLMDGAPVFDAPDKFSPSRIRLGDIDGSGTTDILYLGRHQTRYWINQSGNAFAPAVRLDTFPPGDNHADVALVDLLGNGTSCLVWSSPLPADAAAPWRYLDLMGGVKPYLLAEVDNGVGMATRLAYRPSTYYFLRDRQAGRPWATKLPFPVQVVDRQDTEDRITGNVHVRRFAYHHGYYDRPEREFRGFGCIEEWATEGVTSKGAELFQRPPVLTRSWYHTGAWSELRTLSTQFSKEYSPAGLGWSLPDSELEASPVDEEPLTPAELREARRTLRGRPLRQETYRCSESVGDEYPQALDNPYSITEHRYAVRRLQPAEAGNPHAVFAAFPLETLTRQCEEQASDPRVLHELVLATDDYGQPVRTAAVAYPREVSADPALITVTEHGLVNEERAGWRRIGVPASSLVWELRTPEFATAPIDRSELHSAFAAADAADPSLVYDPADPAGPVKRLLKAEARLYRREADAAALDFVPLDLGEVGPLALPGPAWRLSFTAGLLAAAGLRDPSSGDAGSRAKLADLEARGYRPGDGLATASGLGAGSALAGLIGDLHGFAPGSWWTVEPVAAFDPGRFHVPVRSRDAWGGVTEIEYDARGMLPVSVTDPLGSTVTADNDYRVLGPSRVTDANGSSRQAGFDALGRVVEVARSGSDAAGNPLGDELGDASQTFEYRDDRAADPIDPKPNYVHIRTRNRHLHPSPQPPDPAPGAHQVELWSESRLYSDGFGRELATKQRAPPGLAHWVDEAGILQSGPVADRWIGSGRIFYDNRGDPVRQYEPYFSATAEYEEEDALRMWGVSPDLHYDPLGRVVRTDFPDGSHSRVERTPWKETAWDRNDTADAGGWPIDDPGPAPAPPAPADPKQHAAWAAAAHAETPVERHLDPLGRPARTVEVNRRVEDGGAGPTLMPKEELESRVVLDIEGNELEVRDANGNRALAQVVDLAGRPLNTRSNDAGERWLLPAADDRPGIAWTERGHRIDTECDALRRPTRSWATDPGGTPRLVSEIVYGEVAPDAEQSNLRGQVWKSRDQAGETVNHAFDFKGNLTKSERRLVADPTQEPDWSAAPALETTGYAVEYWADAQDRNVHERAPDGSEIRFRYDVAGRFVSSTVKPPKASAPIAIVETIDYDPKGQRTRIEYGNGVTTDYQYDKNTFRLASLVTRKGAATFQDIAYWYDPEGNITGIVDKAQPTIFTDNAAIEPLRRFRYDALYRLIRAEGREHQSIGSADQHLSPDAAKVPSPADGKALRGYVQHYAYDPVGNIKEMRHVVPGDSAASWTRAYSYDYEAGGGSNRLAETALGKSVESYAHDAHGNILALPHLTQLAWDHADRLREARINGNEAELYAYDAAGERAIKRWDKGGGIDLRIYIGGFFEVFRSYGGGKLKEERTTLHVIDGERRVAMIETETVTGGAPVAAAPRARFQHGDHLDSAALELTETGQLIGYEEFHPYGTTAIVVKGGGAAAGYSVKRYRYTGKERDEATGLNYHSARYSMPWLGRWLSADPAGLVDGAGLYSYCKSPTQLVDQNGMQPSPINDDPTSLEVFAKSTMWTAGRELRVNANVRLSYYLPRVRALDPKMGINKTLDYKWGTAQRTAIKESSRLMNTPAAQSIIDKCRPSLGTTNSMPSYWRTNASINSLAMTSLAFGRLISFYRIYGHLEAISDAAKEGRAGEGLVREGTKFALAYSFAKVGGGIGLMFSPLGSVIGAALGGGFGYMAGDMITDEVFTDAPRPTILGSMVSKGIITRDIAGDPEFQKQYFDAVVAPSLFQYAKRVKEESAIIMKEVEAGKHMPSFDYIPSKQDHLLNSNPLRK